MGGQKVPVVVVMMWRTLVLVAAAVVTVVPPAAAAAAAAAVTAQQPVDSGSDEPVFCSRTQIQETAVRQQLLDTGQVMVSTHVRTSLRVGETVCISAALPEPEALQPAATSDPEHSTDQPAETRLVNMIRNDDNDEEEEGISPTAETGSSGVSGSSTTESGSLHYPSGDPSTAADAEEAGVWTGRRQAREARLPDRAPGPPGPSGRLRRLLLRPAADQRRLRIQLTLESVQRQYAITASYLFSEPQLGVTCTCACAAFHTCAACGPLCVSKASGSPAPDCQGSFLGAARTCCELRVRAGRTFRAVRLGGGVSLLRLRVAVTEEGGGRPARTERQTVEARLGDDLRLELNTTRLRLTSTARAGDVVSRGWYVLHDGQLLQPQTINELNEYNLQKLGWLKLQGDEHLMPSADRLAAAVDINTESCTEQRFQVRGDILLDSTLPQLGPPLAGLRVTGRTPTHLRLEAEPPGQPVLLGLDLRHLQRLRYLVHRARLADFDGALHVDARRAVLAELRLWNASGVQHGTVHVSYSAAGPPPALYRFSLVAERRLRLRLPVALGADQETAEMCLRPEGSQEPAICRQLKVTRQPPERLHRDTGPDSQLTVDGQTNPTNNMERFLRALNPATWLQSGGSWTTAFGAIVDIVLVIIAITIICKCVSCCRAACCCCRRTQKT